MKNNTILRYLAPIFSLAIFAALMMAYNTAYTPAKPSKQRIVCYKFKAGTPTTTIQKHLTDFHDLKREINEIVAYSAGSTEADENEVKSDYEIVHHLTFRTEADIEAFKKNPAYLAFIKKHQSDWDKVLVINADIK
jgi:uncharacterized protein YegL